MCSPTSTTRSSSRTGWTSPAPIRRPRGRGRVAARPGVSAAPSPPAGSRDAAVALGRPRRPRATSASVRMAASGVRSSWAASAVKRRTSSKDRSEPRDHGVEGPGEAPELVLGIGLVQAAVQSRRGDLGRRGGHPINGRKGLTSQPVAPAEGTGQGQGPDGEENDHQLRKARAWGEGGGHLDHERTRRARDQPAREAYMPERVERDAFGPTGPRIAVAERRAWGRRCRPDARAAEQWPAPGVLTWNS